MQFYSDVLEFRGKKKEVSKKGNEYHMLNFEEMDGTPQSFYCDNTNKIPTDLEKGNKARVVCEWIPRYKELRLIKVVKHESTRTDSGTSSGTKSEFFTRKQS